MALISMMHLTRDEYSVESRAHTIYAFMGAFGPPAFVAVCLRLYSRWKFAKIGADDIAVMVGFVLYVGLIIATVYAAKYGLGLHMADVPLETEVQMQKCGFTSQVLYPSSLGAIKLSILLFLLRAIPPGHAWRTRLWIFAGWVVSSEAAFTIALFLQCRPINFYWDKTIEGTCFNQPAFYYVDASLNMATDVCILSLPWFLFRNLNIPKRRKYELLILCSVGIFTLIASIVRLPYLHDLNISKDPTWHVVDICIWSIAELGSAITLSSVPAIRPLITHWFPNLSSTTLNASGGKSSGNGNTAAPAKGSLPTIGSMPNARKIDATWHSYTELEDVDSQKRPSGSLASQENILPSRQRHELQ